MDWVFANWEYILLGFYALEKVVKLTRWPYDDIVFDMIIKPIVQILASKKKEDNAL